MTIKRESLYNILIKFGVPKKLVRLIKICLDGTQSKVRIGNFLSSSFAIENGLKQGNALSPLLFNLTLEYAIRKVQDTNLELEMNGTHQALAYADDVNLIPNAHIKIVCNSYEIVKTFKYLGSLLINKNSIQEEIKCRLKQEIHMYYFHFTLQEPC